MEVKQAREALKEIDETKNEMVTPADNDGEDDEENS